MLTFTNCKINIGLDVVEKRPDGYHNISTCMYPIPWGDIIEIVPSTTGATTLQTLGRTIDCPPEKNLVMKAYRALEKKCSLEPVDIIINKIVPDGAGLGGGSSDAAHTLRLLNEMYSLGLSLEELCAEAANIGADCPFFIYDSPMMAEGIGEILTPQPIDLSGHTIVIAKPESTSISTKQAYAGISPHYPAEPLPSMLSLPIEQWRGRVKNDFEDSIFPLAPEIKALKELMYASGATYASMSGSGASVYGIFKNDKMSDSLIERLGDMPKFVYTPK